MDKTNSLLSINQSELEKLLPIFRKYVFEKMSKYTLKGKLRIKCFRKEPKHSSLKGTYNKLKFYLTYLKNNDLQFSIGEKFNLSQSKVSEWFHFLTSPFEKTLNELKVLPEFGKKYEFKDDGEDYLIVDVVENLVPRQTVYYRQKEEYSGKKKTHTMKYLAISDPYGKIKFLSNAFLGSCHDKTIFDDLDLKINEINLLADLGFQGVQHDFENIILPYKKSKKQELNETQKQTNKVIGSLRVFIEHAFAGVKRLKIIKDKIRIKYFHKRETIMKIAVGLHNFRFDNRKILLNQT